MQREDEERQKAEECVCLQACGRGVEFLNIATVLCRGLSSSRDCVGRE